MLSNSGSSASSGSSSNSQQTTPPHTDGANLSAPNVVSTSPTNIKNVKSEVFSGVMSPDGTNNTVNAAAVVNNNSNIGNTANVNNNNNSNSGSCDGVGASGTTSSIIRQNSLILGAVSSPNNGSDHSNSSNISTSNLSQLVEGVAASDLLQESEKKKKSTIKEEDNGKSTSNEKANLQKTVGSVKEDADMIASLVNVKKEENLSPNMSPVGFGSMVSATGIGTDGSGRSGTPVKLELSVNSSSEKMPSNLGLTNDDPQTATINEVCAGAGGTSGNGSGNGIGNTQPGQGANFVGGNGGGIPTGNCMDYMQQQNHIFVFSTQLANKGAESVLNGQFQTIIAYHCTQPATKSFLEDFFMKNPMKMNKLQRQNSINMCGISGQTWMNAGGVGVGPLSKLQQQPQQQQKSNGSKANFQHNDNNNKTLPNMRGGPTNVTNTFGDGTDSIGNEHDLMCWEQARNNLEASGNDAQSIKLLEGGVDAVLHKCNDVGSTDSIPSLQGVKVPDENLTPQQRQHREEQLAKLKKMNQFLFPEHDNTPNITGPNQINKLPSDNLQSNLMINMPGSGGNTGTPQMLNQVMRQMPTNMNQNKPPDHIPSGLGDDVMLSADIIGDIVGVGSVSGQNIQCNSVQKNACGGNITVQGNMSCSPNVMIANMSSGNNMHCHVGPGGSMISGSPELLGGFGGSNCGGVGVGITDIAKSLTPQDMPPVGIAQMEWSKMQQQFYEERLKGSNKTGTGRLGVSVVGGLSTSSAGAPSQGPNQPMRINSTQGPPPPYHPTQRSASVPIATQSPNPASPNNPTSNLSLPSPRTTGALGIPSNSPNIEASTSTATSATNTSATATTTNNINLNTATAKNCFPPEVGSPSNRNRAGAGLNQFNSNPSTPLSHMSPKDLESFNSSGSVPNTNDLKNPRPSPQRSRSPVGNMNNNNNSNNIIDTVHLEARFPASSPILNFNSQMQNLPNLGMNYKAQGQGSGTNPIERQNSGPGGGPTQYCRRTDNMPLNPNSNRPTQNKLNQSFDPISSLAQMSQQLTSGVSGVGNSSAGGINMLGPNDLNVNQNMEGMLSTIDGSGMEHIGNNGPFGGGAGSNCHPMNPLINSMGHRMLNPKMCGGPGGPGMREGPAPNFHGVMPPSTRMMGRMPVNFGNFNVSPNIQVKASTPNTIQYMPVRPQNNTNSNMRMPSLEFLQRYANPQMVGGGGPMGPSDAGHIIGANPMNASNVPNEQNKIGNNPGNLPVGPSPNNPGNMGFFQNCNAQMTGIDDEGMSSGMLSSHDMNIGQPMIRGMRPHSLRQHNMGPRMQAPLGGQQTQYPGPVVSGSDNLECGDSSPIFNAAGPCNNLPGPGPGPGGQPMFGVNPPQQQKSLKSMPPGMCQNMNIIGSAPGANVVNGPSSGSNMLPNDMGPGMQQANGNGPVMLGNNNMMSGVVCNNMSIPGAPGGPNGPASNNGNGNPNYKPFVGPASNDLKYAQQYHSFQQQLYATTTRSQQQQGGSGNAHNMPPNLSPNPAFFANK